MEETRNLLRIKEQAHLMERLYTQCAAAAHASEAGSRESTLSAMRATCRHEHARACAQPPCLLLLLQGEALSVQWMSTHVQPQHCAAAHRSRGAVLRLRSRRGAYGPGVRSRCPGRAAALAAGRSEASPRADRGSEEWQGPSRCSATCVRCGTSSAARRLQCASHVSVGVAVCCPVVRQRAGVRSRRTARGEASSEGTALASAIGPHAARSTSCVALVLQPAVHAPLAVAGSGPSVRVPRLRGRTQRAGCWMHAVWRCAGCSLAASQLPP
jgi:hypothetical protein